MLLLLIALAAGAIYFFITHQYSHWERTNLPNVTPQIPFGSLGALSKRERSFGLIIYDIYRRSSEKILGIYLLFRPAILIRDAELVRTILTKDFDSFMDRGVYVDEENNPLSGNIFSLRGQSWKTLRAKLTPSFSSGKLKGMFNTIDDVGQKLVSHLDGTLPEQGTQQVELKQLFTTYAVDIIGSVIFGLDIDSFTHPDNEFRRLSTKVFAANGVIDLIRGISSIVCPSITKIIHKFFGNDIVLDEMRDIIKHTIEFREKNNVRRKDLLQLLIQLRNTGKISEDDDHIWDVETAAEGLKSMSIDSIAAQAFIFYIAGSETTAATIAFTLYELAMNPDLMKRLQLEIETTFEKHNLTSKDKLTYDAIHEMKFLDLCIMETTRKYPGLPFLNRECTQDYAVPDSNVVIAKGTPIIISLFGLHRDAEYFPEPEKYDPERFLEENRNYNPVAYLPFGEGPRHCIAQRMGKVNAKVGIVKILSNFNIEPLERKELEFVFDQTPVLLVKGGLNVQLSRKKKLL